MIHADESALSLLWDRNHRPREEGEKLSDAHACRLLGDSLSYIFLIWSALLEAFDLEKKELEDVYGEAKQVFHQLNLIGESFWRTQETQ